MSLKMICEEAGVNKGIFNYYFKTKSNFICRVLESFSDEASQNAESEPPAGATSIERLRHFLTTMGRNFRDHRKVALADRGMPGRRLHPQNTFGPSCANKI